MEEKTAFDVAILEVEAGAVEDGVDEAVPTCAVTVTDGVIDAWIAVEKRCGTARPGWFGFYGHAAVAYAATVAAQVAVG